MTHPSKRALDSLAGEEEELAGIIEKVESAPYRRLKSVVSKLGGRESSAAIASTLLKLGRLATLSDPGRARNLARAALFAAKRVASPETVRESLVVEGECLFADASRRLGRLRSAERSFARAAQHLALCDLAERAFFLATSPPSGTRSLPAREALLSLTPA